ncbi:MAG: GatB/YqeY domain-containing protein [Ruminococcaceae bacterium]|nr:GatB/YqeY domain-containing protein [Oscillospiraceae bacterium]
MSLKETLAQDLKVAMKDKDTVRKNTVQSIRAAVLQVEKDSRIVLDDDGVIGVIAKELKKRKDVLPDYEKSGRDDLIAELKKEIEVLTGYLPSQLSQEELDGIVKDAIDRLGATSMKDMGKIMADVMPKITGRADGGAVNQTVRKLLGL